ncbi:MAG TPA: TraB/GumN family protein [Thermoanaerobaculia bacterium]|nr:TraB/GumN family protein [Thermoanaerobaculia bacterium]
MSLRPVDAPVTALTTLREHTLPDGREILLLGTAHVSKQSVADVARAVEELAPDQIAVELCEARYRNLTDREAWRRLDIFKVLREGKAPLLLSSLVMTSFQRRIAKELGVVPGAEMLEAIERAKEKDLSLELIDRDIQVTLRRTWGRLGWWGKLKLMSQLVGSLFVGQEIDEEMVEKLKQEEELAGLLEAMAAALPQVKSTLIDERDRYMAQRLRQTTGRRVLAVIGAGHLAGIARHLDEESDLAPLEQVPPRSWVPRLIAWAIPVAIVALLVVGFLRGGVEESITSIVLWVLVNGVCAALGALAAFGHPLTVAAAFVAAPITSLNPLIAAGWVAGLVQAWIHRPTVSDLEDLPEDITTLKGFWGNSVSRILLVVVLANLGSMLGTFIAGGWIAARTL